MAEKILGKITFAEYGQVPDYPFLFGLQLDFKLADATYISSGSKYTVNISPACKWESESREQVLVNSMAQVNQILNDAKVNYVSQLVNKPVEVTIENNCFKDFRILTEVL